MKSVVEEVLNLHFDKIKLVVVLSHYMLENILTKFWAICPLPSRRHAWINFGSNFKNARNMLLCTSRAVASLSPPGGQDKSISSICPHFPVVYIIFPQIFFLILVFRVGGSPTREGPGYATVYVKFLVMF